MQSKRPMSERNNAPQTKTSLVTGTKAIKSMRDIMIALSYIPIVFFAVCSIIYSHFPPLDAEIYSQYVLTGMCGVVVVFAVTLLFKAKLMFGLVAKSGLWLIAASFFDGGVCMLVGYGTSISGDVGSVLPLRFDSVFARHVDKLGGENNSCGIQLDCCCLRSFSVAVASSCCGSIGIVDCRIPDACKLGFGALGFGRIL